MAKGVYRESCFLVPHIFFGKYRFGELTGRTVNATLVGSTKLIVCRIYSHFVIKTSLVSKQKHLADDVSNVVAVEEWHPIR
jgi:hypothetical protein